MLYPGGRRSALETEIRFLVSFISSIQPTKHFKIPVNPILECPNYSFQSTFVPGRRIKIKLALSVSGGAAAVILLLLVAFDSSKSGEAVL